MSERKDDYDKIHDDLYDDDPCDVLTIETNKELAERQNISTLEGKINSHNGIDVINQIDSLSSQKPCLEFTEKNNIMAEVEKCPLKNKETSLDCEHNKNMNITKEIDVHSNTSTQINNSIKIQNECIMNIAEGNKAIDANLKTTYASELKKTEKETMNKENNEVPQEKEKDVYTSESTFTRKERYNIYEHGVFNDKTEVLQTEGINDTHNNMGGTPQVDRTMQNGASETANNIEQEEDKRDKNESRNTFECNICFDDVRDPVVTKCGHLFCWSCLSSWIKKNNDCPVCKAEVLKETVIPLYGRGTRTNDHAYKNDAYEPRPTPKRKEPTIRTRSGNNNVGLRALGVWVNPFSFALSYTNMSEEPYFGDNTTENRRIQTETYQAEIASSLFFFLGCFISLYLFFFPS